MTPLLALAAASVTGAVLFFAAGLLLARGNGAAMRAALARSQADLASARSDLTSARGDLGSVTDDRRRLADEVVRLSAAPTLIHPTRPARPAPTVPPRAAAVVAADPAELDVLRRRLADADEVRDDNTRLRAEAAAARELSIRLAATEDELADLRQRANRAQLGPRLPTGSGFLRVPGSFDALVAQLARDPRVAAAVVSDELGLLVAGTGADAEALAAVGGYLAGVGERAQALVHLGPTTRVIVEDDRGAAISATRLVGQPLVAVTLTRARPTVAPAAARR